MSPLIESIKCYFMCGFEWVYGVCSNLASSGKPPPSRASQNHFNHWAIQGERRRSFNWIASFFRDHSHITKYGTRCLNREQYRRASYRALVLDRLHTLSQHLIYTRSCRAVLCQNMPMIDTYLIIPVDNLQSCTAKRKLPMSKAGLTTTA